MKPERVKKITFTEISVVPASKCDACGERMIPYDSIHWKCGAEGCTAYGLPVHIGVYPIRYRSPMIVDDIEGPPPTKEQREAFRKWVKDYDFGGPVEITHVECDCDEDPFVSISRDDRVRCSHGILKNGWCLECETGGGDAGEVQEG